MRIRLSGAALLLLSVTALIGGAGTALAQDDPLIERGAVWKYLDDGSDQGTAWRGTGFDDSGWAEGPAELGYGDGEDGTFGKQMMG